MPTRHSGQRSRSEMAPSGCACHLIGWTRRELQCGHSHNSSALGRSALTKGSIFVMLRAERAIQALPDPARVGADQDGTRPSKERVERGRYSRLGFSEVNDPAPLNLDIVR